MTGKNIQKNKEGKIEQVIDYDAEGLPLKSRHDQDADGVFETVRFYRKGEIIRQETDGDKNGALEEVQIDSNLDGKIDQRRFLS